MGDDARTTVTKTVQLQGQLGDALVVLQHLCDWGRATRAEARVTQHNLSYLLIRPELISKGFRALLSQPVRVDLERLSLLSCGTLFILQLYHLCPSTHERARSPT